MALHIASVQLGSRGTGHSAQASGLCFFPLEKKKNTHKKRVLEALCGHSGAVER